MNNTETNLSFNRALLNIVTSTASSYRIDSWVIIIILYFDLLKGKQDTYLMNKKIVREKKTRTKKVHCNIV